MQVMDRSGCDAQKNLPIVPKGKGFSRRAPKHPRPTATTRNIVQRYMDGILFCPFIKSPCYICDVRNELDDINPCQ